MAKINFRVVKQQVERQAGGRIVRTTERILKRRYENALNTFLEEVQNHPISQEIAAGPRAPNISNTLGRESGNLFSFFGFEEGDLVNPIEKLLEYLEGVIKRTSTRIVRNRKHITTRSEVTVPTLENIASSDAASITPKYANQGWIKGVRKGHAGYERYIYEVARALRTSRSGTGLQISGPAQAGTFFPKSSYLSKELTTFIRSLKK